MGVLRSASAGSSSSSRKTGKMLRGTGFPRRFVVPTKEGGTGYFSSRWCNQVAHRRPSVWLSAWR